MIILLNGQTMQKFKLTIKHCLDSHCSMLQETNILNWEKKKFSHQVARTEIVSRE